MEGEMRAAVWTFQIYYTRMQILLKFFCEGEIRKVTEL
jgi:hypothetical protein